MARRSSKRPYGGGHRELDMTRLASMPHDEIGTGGRTYKVSRVSGGAKSYTCPGCNQSIAAGIPHVVAWLADASWGTEIGVGARRHWHTYCWEHGIRP